MTSLMELTDRGLYCAAGDFYVDPWQPVPRAVITHAHSDHARFGSAAYLTAAPGVEVLRERVGLDAQIESVEYAESIRLNGVSVTLHPAGHILGSAQIRIEHRGQICVVSGDYKTQADPTCQVFEPVRCHTFITESTFALPIYHWQSDAELFAAIHAWWQRNQQQRRTSVIYAYSLGKAQRVLAGLDPSVGPILVHGAVDRFLPHYRHAHVPLPYTERATTENAQQTRGTAMVVAPPSAAGTPWLRKFGPVSAAMASGWMQIRGARRRRSLDAGFALSDHADWTGLLSAIAATGAEEVWATHGYSSILVRWLSEHGLAARAIRTAFEGELIEDTEATADGDQASAITVEKNVEPVDSTFGAKVEGGQQDRPLRADGSIPGRLPR